MSLLMGKSILSTVVVALAVGQALSMAQVPGRFKLLPVSTARLRQWHRWAGDATLLLNLIIALLCVFLMARSRYPIPVPVHAAWGTLAAGVMLAKVAIAGRFRRLLRHAVVLAALGAIAGFSVLGAFASSALLYFRWGL